MTGYNQRQVARARRGKHADFIVDSEAEMAEIASALADVGVSLEGCLPGKMPEVEFHYQIPVWAQFVLRMGYDHPWRLFLAVASAAIFLATVLALVQQ
jgi:hypothetical protein